MIEFKKYTLNNGLRLLVHEDASTPMVAVNTLYDVGARDEVADKTGFAHLFEHLMFGGSANIPSFDGPLQNAGGQNNAFTNNDYTNYYITIPRENLETAFWLESDRMLNLAFTPESLEVQRKVVIEEFKQRYLNQPYGDAWLELRPMAYKKHPYQWATIGKEIAHIEEATMDDVRSFFKNHYHPSNAILVVAGNVDANEVYERVKYWYGDIPSGVKITRNLPKEDVPSPYEIKVLNRPVPQNSIYLSWPMPDRLSPDYYAADLISDVLSLGKSARFYQKLVKDQQLFTSVQCYILGSLDPGLIVATGMVDKNHSFEDAKKGVLGEIEKLVSKGPEPSELEKVKNKLLTSQMVSESNVLSKAMNLAYYELLGDASMVNEVMGKYEAVTAEDIKRVAGQIFKPAFMKELRYQVEENKK
jgi:predicted Zn-dependent peptidase